MHAQRLQKGRRPERGHDHGARPRHDGRAGRAADRHGGEHQDGYASERGSGFSEARFHSAGFPEEAGFHEGVEGDVSLRDESRDDAASFGARVRGSPGPIVLDGGLATELETRGYDVSGPLWSARLLLDAPEAIEQLHADYFAAGASCATTASYQASYQGFSAAGVSEDQTTALLGRSVSLARAARELIAGGAGRGAPRVSRYVAASVGPFGASRHDGSEYHGDYGLTVTDLVAFHERRFHVLADSGADVLACETIPSLDEVRALAQLLRDRPSVEAWVSCTSRDGLNTAHGEPLSDVARLLDDVPNVVAVGVNCVHPAVVLKAIRELRRHTDKAIIVYPNDGSRWNAKRRAWEGVPGDRIEELAPAWVEAGARLVGGCCRIGPSRIAALASALRS